MTEPTEPEPTPPTAVVDDAPADKAVPAAAGSVIALRADQEEFDHKQLSTLALISPGLAKAPRGHLAMYFHYCVKTGLDPFARQIYLIGRKNWKAENDPDEPEMTWTIQTGIDGFRATAHRAAARTGESISYEDTLYFDAEGKEYKVWVQPGPPAAVQVTVLRGQSRFPFIARWAEFAPVYWDKKRNEYVLASMWRQMGSHMLRKCAEAGSLRMAAPHDLSGMYVDEEMAQADAEAVAGVAEDHARRLRAAAGLEADEQQGEEPTGVGEQPAKATAPPRRRKKAASSEEPRPAAAEEVPKRPRKRAASKKAAAADRSPTSKS
ncbi:recombinase RecT [Streptomyces sp. PTM05]|uniref:Recombinase RecT n=1 Tax=Streptantibioticus parmotrematis TaxID=2873249 RepID=A0ABS7QR05_9ACTN|nr:recombinase RecT [Streptantibioticus parmotrematis]MBY8884805.1 recombinase RecT [Streptantibioticus parmotrematis]